MQYAQLTFTLGFTLAQAHISIALIDAKGSAFPDSLDESGSSDVNSLYMIKTGVLFNWYCTRR